MLLCTDGMQYIVQMKLTTHLHLVLRLRMSEDVHLLPLYAVMVCTGTALPFQYFSLLLQLCHDSLMQFDAADG